MGILLSSVAEENKLFDGSGNVGVCENPQAGAGVGAVAGAGKKPVCVCVCESSLTPSLVFVVQTVYDLLHISETLSRKGSVFEHKFISKI